nr:helix-turn-helix domain-containing protein [uncultured Draconibacterium sp.]
MSLNVLELAEKYPKVKFELTGEDLMKFSEDFHARKRRELEEAITSEKTETYPSARTVCEMLDVNHSTLWRWAKRGYLVPINVGDKNRYRMSDIKKILEGGRKALQNS